MTNVNKELLERFGNNYDRVTKIAPVQTHRYDNKTEWNAEEVYCKVYSVGASEGFVYCLHNYSSREGTIQTHLRFKHEPATDGQNYLLLVEQRRYVEYDEQVNCFTYAPCILVKVDASNIYLLSEVVSDSYYGRTKIKYI